MEIPGLGAQEYDGWAMKGEGLLVPSALHESVVLHPRNVLQFLKLIISAMKMMMTDWTADQDGH